jgi:hypothetical protein
LPPVSSENGWWCGNLETGEETWRSSSVGRILGPQTPISLFDVISRASQWCFGFTVVHQPSYIAFMLNK